MKNLMKKIRSKKEKPWWENIFFFVKSSFVLSTTHFSLKTTAILQSSCGNSLIMLKPDDILSLGETIDFPTMVLLFLLDVDSPLFIVLIGVYVISVSQKRD